MLAWIAVVLFAASFAATASENSSRASCSDASFR